MADAVAGNLLIVAGDTEQMFPPANEQESVTVPVKASCAAMLIGPLVWLPALTLGNAVGSVKVKSGFVVTITERDCVLGAGAPRVFAEIETVVAPIGVVYGAVTVTPALTGALTVGSTLADGEKLHVAPAGKPTQLKVTVPPNEPEAVT